MGIAERKDRERAERELRITAAARAIAAREGWSAVTIRRLADEIEYSQPVLYSHFRNRDAIVAAVAVEGFGELAAALHAAGASARTPATALEKVATAYIEFAIAHAALYDAMFVAPVDLAFAQADTPQPLRDAFDALAKVVAPFCADAELATETCWAALHGAAELERHGRIRPALRGARVKLIVRSLINTVEKKA